MGHDRPVARGVQMGAIAPPCSLSSVKGCTVATSDVLHVHVANFSSLVPCSCSCCWLVAVPTFCFFVRAPLNIS